MDWAFLDKLEPRTIFSGESFSIRYGGHPRFVQYVEGTRKLTLVWDWEDLTSQSGRRLFLLRRFGRVIKVPAVPTWDGDRNIPLTIAEANVVFERLCRVLGRKSRPCRMAIDDNQYERK